MFGVPELGALISQVHSTSISAGRELESIILERSRTISDLDAFLAQDIITAGVSVASKEAIKQCETIDYPGAEPDFMIFRRKGTAQECLVLELKDGDAFDTKKAAGERANLHRFIQYLGTRIPWTVDMRFCCFNQPDKDKIRAGFKNKISEAQAMTGSELCGLLNLDYAEIVREREKDQPENLTVFVEKLLGIEAVKSEIVKSGNFNT
ncbi:MAG: restriction endonuclease [Candidatus Dadabacteria bacterium]|nr:restriction endonuclease [Candidatus Dadabacteria bacterium]